MFDEPIALTEKHLTFMNSETYHAPTTWLHKKIRITKDISLLKGLGMSDKLSQEYAGTVHQVQLGKVTAIIKPGVTLTKDCFRVL